LILLILLILLLLLLLLLGGTGPAGMIQHAVKAGITRNMDGKPEVRCKGASATAWGVESGGFGLAAALKGSFSDCGSNY